jgi:CheY-like chemotaxis protein
MTCWGRAEQLAGRRVLVVEDEIFVAMLVEGLLLDLGCDVVGPVSNVADALVLVANERLDAAVLDVNLGAERVFPVADRLTTSAVPFVFVTGYDRTALTETYSSHPMIQKPFEPLEFGEALAVQLAKAAGCDDAT